jgi:ABC-type tungstate transport system substrate-binding protein
MTSAPSVTTKVAMLGLLNIKVSLVVGFIIPHVFSARDFVILQKLKTLFGALSFTPTVLKLRCLYDPRARR